MAKRKEKGLVLSFEKAILLSDGIIDGVKLHLRRLTGVQPTGEANIQTLEFAVVEQDPVTVKFQFKPLAIDKRLTQTNNEEVLQKMQRLYKDETFKWAVEKNAEYIVYNILSTNWLWRNREIADDIEINVKSNGFEMEISEVDVPLIDINPDSFEIVSGNEEFLKAVKDLAQELSAMFLGKKESETFEVKTTLKTEEGMPFYPSELFLEGKSEFIKTAKKRYPDLIGDDSFKGWKSDSKIRFYYINPITQKPALTDVKIGNRLRTYDVWYEEYPKIKEPIPIEINGGNLKYQRKLRKNTFEVLLRKIIEDKNLTDKDKIYLAGCLIRGGVPIEKGE